MEPLFEAQDWEDLDDFFVFQIFTSETFKEKSPKMIKMETFNIQHS